MIGLSFLFHFLFFVGVGCVGFCPFCFGYGDGVCWFFPVLCFGCGGGWFFGLGCFFVYIWIGEVIFLLRNYVSCAGWDSMLVPQIFEIDSFLGVIFRSVEQRKNCQSTYLQVDYPSSIHIKSRPKNRPHIRATERQGRPIGLRDTLIVVIALTRDCSIATRNQAHFSRISDLRIITP
jgi:hypothetical protein